MQVGEAGTVVRVGTIGTPHTSAPGKQQGLVCTGTCTQTGANGGELAWPSFSKVLRCVKPSVPSPEMGFTKREPMIRWGPRDRFPLRSNARRGVLSP